MKKIIMTMAVLFGILFNANAQIEKNYIFRCGRGNIGYTEPVEKKQTTGKAVKNILGTVLETAAGMNTQVEDHPEYADAVIGAISGGINSARRINVIDGEFTPGEVAEGEEALYFDGNISSIKTTRRISISKDDKGKTHETTDYKASITAMINIKKYGTDEIVKTLNINESDYSYAWISTADGALTNTLSNISQHIAKILNNTFPLYASIVEGNYAKKDKQKEVYIDLGEQFGAFKGMTFNVYTVKTIAGREAKKEIGRLRITEVMGDDISLCKVTRGGKEIKESIDNGDTLLITSTN